MRRIQMIAVAAMLAGTVLQGAEDGTAERYKPLMKTAAGAADRLKAALKKEDSAAARTSAEELSRSMTAIQEFWQGRDSADAIGFAGNLKKAADEIRTKAEAGDFPGASGLLESARENCEGCHKAHRKMSLGGWKLK